MRTLLFCALFASAAAQAATVSVTVTDKDGKPVQDAVVVVVPAQANTSRRALPTSATVTQDRMQFVPAVTLVGPGSRLTFVNNDVFEHHVRGSAAGLAQFTSAAAGGFELRLDGKVEGKAGKTADVVVDKAGAVLLGCHIHGSMRGHVYVSDSPWAARTTPEGQAVFDDVPDGNVQIRVWHADQLLDLPVRTGKAGATAIRESFQLQVVPRRRRT